MGCKDTVLPEPLLKNHNVNCLTFERNTRQPYNDNLCLFRALALHLHGNEKLEEETSKNFNFFLKNSEEGDVSKSQSVLLKDIPKAEDLLQLNILIYDIDFLDGELIEKLARRSIQKYEKKSNFYATTIKFATSTTSKHCLKPSGVQRVTHLSQRWRIWNKIWLLEWSCKTYLSNECLWTERNTFWKVGCIQRSIKKWSKTVEELGNIWLWVHLCQGRIIQANWDYNVDWEACAHVSFHIVKLDPGTQFSPQHQSSSSHLVFYYCSRRMRNSKQSSNQTAFYWSRDCNQDNTMCYTGTAQPKTQRSVKFRKWVYRGGRGKGFIYTIPAYAKESINWLRGTFWALL